jgi:hypothetical protein
VYRRCQNVDETGAPHVAITLEISGLLGTDDEYLLEARGFDNVL